MLKYLTNGTKSDKIESKLGSGGHNMKTKISLLLTVILLMTLSLSFADGLSDAQKNEINGSFKGLWVATVLNLDYPVKATTNVDTLKKEAIEILDKAQSMGLNAIVLQVRPAGDAIYSSAYFPWSKYLTGKQGTAPADGFDPLAFWIDEAHKRNLELHAWINPYRITRKNASDPSYDYSSLAANHPARLHPDWVVEHTDGNLYFDPGNPEVRKYLVDSINELITKYDVDGIHFDDYFYPGTTFNDDKTYAKYGSKFNSKADWRRNNVDQLIKEVKSLIDTKKPIVQFGISPFGIWANAKNKSGGSDTSGFESYFNQYADTKKWVEEEWIDYIAPQLYWEIGYSVADYSKLVKWWSNVVDGTDVHLYIGQAAYRTGDKSSSSPWYGVDEIARQLQLNESYDEVSGSIFFRYAFFKASPTLSALLTDYYNGTLANATINTKLTIGRPVKDVSTTSSYYFVGGASNPNSPLYINGEEVIIRTKDGYFGKYVALKSGKNTFVVSQDGKTATRVITKVGATLATPMTKAEIIAGSTWPQSATMINETEEFKFYCRAPIGAKVTATLGGKTYTLTPETTKNASNKLYSTAYSLKIKAPVQTGSARIVDYGKPVYTMSYNGVTNTQSGNVNVRVIMKNAPFIATVSSTNVDSYQSASASNGAHYILQTGMTDLVTGINGDYIRLSSGIWVKSKSVELKDQKMPSIQIKSIANTVAARTETLKFELSSLPIASAEFDGEKLKITINKASNSVQIPLKSNSMIKSAVSKSDQDKITYELTFKDAKTFAGHNLEVLGNQIIITLKTKFVASGELPLKGAIILLDAGHGGSDTGAIGLLGYEYPEKMVNFNIVKQLENELKLKGATVVLTRTSDDYVSLDTRLSQSMKLSPDMLISIHADSLEDTADLTKTSGFTVYYKESLSKSLANNLSKAIDTEFDLYNRGVKNMNFYIVRNTWTPSVLIETGFMPSPSDFQILSNSIDQKRYAKTLTNAIVNYFSGE